MLLILESVVHQRLPVLPATWGIPLIFYRDLSKLDLDFTSEQSFRTSQSDEELGFTKTF